MYAHLNRPGRGGQQIVVGALSVLALLGASACSSVSGTANNMAGGAKVVTAKPAVAKAKADPKPSATKSPTKSPSDDTNVKPKDLPKQPKGVSLKKPKDPMAPKAVKQVERNGKKPHPTVTTRGGTQPFTKPVNYTDGLKLKVTGIKQGKMSGHGPGVYPGRPTSTFHLTLTNGAKKPIKLGVVVVTVTYGSPARVAHHIYDGSSSDFYGVIKPGGHAKAVYGFSVPPQNLGDVAMTVDIDGVHHLANFTGSVK